jgi:LysW-gamma-L-lysine/LysW-L-ornithine aminotransferase
MDEQRTNESEYPIESRHGSGALKPAPLAIVKGSGVRLFDQEGRSYLDCGTGIGVAALGHAHPTLTQAISEQASTLMTCPSAYYHNDVRTQLMQKLAAIAPKDLDRIFLSNSGTEAVETALKLARVCTGKPGIVAAMRGFHGRTMGALSTTWKPAFRKGFDPLLPGVTHVPFNDIARLKQAMTSDVAALILEPIQGEGGIHPASQGYLEAARDLCDASGALLIFDEVQSGMGRTGRWFACEHYQVTPDILCVAKALGGGVPVAATIFPTALSFAKGQHGSTYGGNPLACRAALTVIDVIEKEDLLHQITEVGAYFLQRLEELQRAMPEKIRDVRGMGLMLAVELRTKAGPVLKALMEQGVLALSGGSTIVRFLPPYMFTKANADEALNALESVLQ